MPARVGTEPSQFGGNESAWEDGLHSGDRGGGNVPRDHAHTEGQARGSTSSQHYYRDGALEKKAWFEPINEASNCEGGVCPVPWAKGVKILTDSTFLSSDRDSNFPGENTIQGRPLLQEDLVNHPSHYADGGIECIEAIEAALTNEEFRGYCKGNCIKYIWRERHKGGTESLKKARWYLNRLIELDEV